MNISDLDIVLIMGLYPKEIEQKIKADAVYGLQNAANVFQWNMLLGLSELNCNVRLYNSIYIGSYPKKYRKLIIPSFKFNVYKIRGENIGFLNFPVLKEWFRYLTLKRKLKKWAQNNKQNKCIISYAATYPMTRILKYIKQINPSIQTCLVVPDLPDYMNLSQKKLTLLHKLKNRIVNDLVKIPDCYVLLTEQMKYRIPDAVQKKSVVIEGMINKEIEEKDDKSLLVKYGLKKNRYILYTGTLNYQYGILDLLDSFEKIQDQKLELVICGEGEAQQLIRKKQDENIKIHYLGLCNHDEIFTLQKNSFALVNPRKNEGEYTKYSFPSKTIEYLFSGRPTIMYMLDGIPLEYKEHFINVDDFGNIENAIDFLTQMSSKEIEDFGDNAKKFIVQKKNCNFQMLKVLKMFMD